MKRVLLAFTRSIITNKAKTNLYLPDLEILKYEAPTGPVLAKSTTTALCRREKTKRAGKKEIMGGPLETARRLISDLDSPKANRRERAGYGRDTALCPQACGGRSAPEEAVKEGRNHTSELVGNNSCDAQLRKPCR